MDFQILVVKKKYNETRIEVARYKMMGQRSIAKEGSGLGKRAYSAW